MANLVVDVMKARGVKFHQHVVMDSISKQDDGKLLATWKETDIGKNGLHSDVFDTVLFAIGRRPLTSNIGLENTLVKLNAKNGKVIELANEQTHEPNIYAVGDVLDVSVKISVFFRFNYRFNSKNNSNVRENRN